MITQNIKDWANEFYQSHEGLEINNTEEAYIHDVLHSCLGMGVSLEDEEIVLNVTEVLQGGECLPKHAKRVENLIAMISNLPVFFEIVESLNS